MVFPVADSCSCTGTFSTLKTYIGLNCAREIQQRGGVAAVIDTEHAFDPSWAAEIGVNVDDLIIEQPASGEIAIDIAELLLRGGVSHITFDSVAAALPESEAEKRMHDEKIQPARLAALMSAAMRRLTAANQQNASMLWINQTRVNLGVTFGSNEALPGGKALPYYASLILSVRKTGKVTRDVKFYDGDKWQSGKEQYGQKFKAEIMKSKLSKPFRDVWFQWNMDMNQIDLPAFLFAQGVDLGLVQQKGNTWSTDGLKAVGREKFVTALAGSEAALTALENTVREHHGLPLIVAPAAVQAPSRARTGKKPLRKGKR